MISVSRLLCNNIGPGDGLRYQQRSIGNDRGSDKPDDAPRPVIVWNCTRQCNLSCIHCYASARNAGTHEEMSTAQGMQLIRDLNDFGVPVILFSGGEPLLRSDLFELASFAAAKKIRVSLSTNGTLITNSVAERIGDVGFAEVGISLDGIGASNDTFRGQGGAFRLTLEGIRNCITRGVRVSLRMTITRFNFQEIPALFKLAETEGIDRLCFYHLAYSGRGKDLLAQDVTLAQAREVVDDICNRTIDLHRRGLPKEVLTVGNHADGVYLYMNMMKRDPERARKMRDLLTANGGNNSGIRIGAIDELGDVHPDQFWQHYSLGNVRNRKFGDIWTDMSEPLLKQLRDRKKLLIGKCGRCRHIDLCNGNLRVRAESKYHDLWAEDPACYLTDDEIESNYGL